MEDLKLIRLTVETQLKPFDCGDTDLNDFFYNDAKRLAEQLLATTYVYENNEETVAFFSLLNDKITIGNFASNRKYKRFKQIQLLDKQGKSFSSYPAVKIGRFAVSINHQRNQHGKDLLNYIKQLFITHNRTGCRFLTVDAYNNPKTLAFYKREDFEILDSVECDNNDEKTILMYFNLMRLTE